MNKKLFIHELFKERLLNLKKPCFGDAYGIEDKNAVIFVGALCTNTELPSTHDLSLLLPSPFSVCGTFTKDIKENETPEKMHLPVLEIANGTVHSKIRTQDGVWKSSSPSKISQEEFNEKFTICRTRFDLDLTSKDKTADIKTMMSNIVDNVSSACYQLVDKDLVLNSDGIVAIDGDENRKIGELSSKPKKKSYSNLKTLDFVMLIDNSAAEASAAPVVKGPEHKVSIQRTCLKAECVSYTLKDMNLELVGKSLQQSVVQHVKLAEYWLLKQQTDSEKVNDPLKTLNVLPYKAGHLFSLIYPSSLDEKELKSYRAKVQASFLLPENFPFFKRNNAYEFDNDKEALHLYNPHIGLDSPKVRGLINITKGIYSYHHYMQDKFNDNKWGCAYRSLQTIISWFRHQGYTVKPVPSHRQIQECLVNLGDRPAKFIGTNQWIGSTEVGYVLESYLGVTSRVISVNSGADLGDKGRELLHHFKTQGTPIMIGGGVLAHTILGVAWNSDTGDISYLILDPHYTGSEDLSVIQKQGWCGWKGPDFWETKAYYNLCLPQRPLTT